MKVLLLAIAAVALTLPARANLTDYQRNLEAARDRFGALESAMYDFRKTKPGLSPAEEAEHRRLLGQLHAEDPVWALTRHLQADIDALASIRERTAEEGAILEDLKDLLAIASGVQDSAKTQVEAETLATALRQFVVRRDAKGALAWAKTQLE